MRSCRYSEPKPTSSPFPASYDVVAFTVASPPPFAIALSARYKHPPVVALLGVPDEAILPCHSFSL